MGNNTSDEKHNARERKDVIEQLVKFGYEKSDILKAMHYVNKPNDVWEVMEYLNEQKEKEYNKMSSTIDKIDKQKEINDAIPQDSARDWNVNMDNAAKLKRLTKLSKNELIEMCKEKQISHDGTKNQIIARLLEYDQFDIAAPKQANTRNNNEVTN
eukprot:14758_1